MFTILFVVFAATTLCLVGAAFFVWLGAPSPCVAVDYDDEELDDEDEPGEPMLPSEPQPSSDGGAPDDESLIDWDEFDAVRAAHEDRLAASTM